MKSFPWSVWLHASCSTPPPRFSTTGQALGFYYILEVSRICAAACDYDWQGLGVETSYFAYQSPCVSLRSAPHGSSVSWELIDGVYPARSIAMLWRDVFISGVALFNIFDVNYRQALSRFRLSYHVIISTRDDMATSLGTPSRQVWVMSTLCTCVSGKSWGLMKLKEF